VPCILELGGKSPCIVDRTCHLEYTAAKVVNGKFINFGQTCIAPDYLLVDETIVEKLLAMIAKEIKDQFSSGDNKEDYCHAINDFHHNRLC